MARHSQFQSQLGIFPSQSPVAFLLHLLGDCVLVIVRGDEFAKLLNDTRPAGNIFGREII